MQNSTPSLSKIFSAYKKEGRALFLGATFNNLVSLGARGGAK